MKNVILSILFTIMTMNLGAQGYLEIPLSGKGFATNGITLPEQENGHVIDNISKGMLYVYRPAVNNKSPLSIVIIPGGGYSREAIYHEGHDFARWLSAEGVTAIVYKYRLPNGNAELPLKDAEEVFEVVRAHAKEWSIDPQKVGVMGFSAGGHYASVIATLLSPENRPNYAVLIYPVISMQQGIGHQGSKNNLLGMNPSKELEERFSTDKQVTASTPPTLLLLSDDDKGVLPENSTLFYNALKRNNVAAAMHIFPSGGHGWGFKRAFTYHEQMKTILLDWVLKR